MKVSTRLKKLIRAARLRTLMSLRPIHYSIHGIRLPTDPALVPDEVARLIFEGRYETAEAKICRAELETDDRVLELGGGIGLIGTLCATICGSESVLTYEANPTLEHVIRKTHALNGVAPTLRVRAISAEGGEITFYANDNVISSSLIDRHFGGATPVPADALRDVVAEFRPTALVCDIEGAETSVLPAADLSGVEKIIIELHPRIVGDDENDALVHWLENNGFGLVAGEKKKVAFFRRRTV